jgi:hypothetical protein
MLLDRSCLCVSHLHIHLPIRPGPSVQLPAVDQGSCIDIIRNLVNQTSSIVHIYKRMYLFSSPGHMIMRRQPQLLASRWGRAHEVSAS